MSTMNVICDRKKPPLGGLIAAEHLKLSHKIEITWGDITCVENGQTSTLCASSNDLCRVLARLLADKQIYGETALEKTEVDHWLSYSIGPLTNKHEFTKSLNYLNKVLGPVTYLVGKRLTIADFSVFAALYASKEWHAVQAKHEVPIHVQRWYNLIASRRAVSNVLSNLTEEIKAAITSAPSSRQSERLSLDRRSSNQTTLDKSATGQRNQEGKFVELPGAEMGKVVVRFPPEASGYLHIGHAKAALLNQYYQQAFDGKLIMRFDDTNPAKENVHFEQVILEDLEMLEIKPDLFTHTSNYFDLMIDYCVQLIKDGKAYVDDTEPELMKQQREQKFECANRSNSVEKNLAMWQEMLNGTAVGQKFCVRAKIDMQSPNGCMRDPTIYRCKNEVHPRTGTKYKVYPTYDFACPIVDAIEGVTHTLRTMEYHDRDAQFYWFIEALGLRRPVIWEYSRLSMTNTVLSKRKLTWFVQEGLVDGWYWDDPRFPTVRGVLRRGMTVEGLKQFIIAQGSSRSVVFMEWDKIWAFNKKVIDPIAPRYTALESDNTVPVIVQDAKLRALEVPAHPKNPEIGNKNTWIGPKILIDYSDAEQLKQGENTTFINWGNLLIKKINRDNDKIVSVEAQTNLANKDYKKTLKLTWLCETENAPFTPCFCVYFDHIISKPVLGKDEDFKKYIGHDTRVEVEMLGDPELKKLKKGDIIQLQRRGFFKVDVAYASPNEISLKTCPVILFHIPDGHTKENIMATAIKNNKKELQKRTASELVAEILKQEEIIRNSVAQAKESAQKHLNRLKDEFSSVTKLDWNDKRIQCTITESNSNTASTNTEPTIICSITEEQVNQEKDPQLKALLSELLQIKTACGLTPSLNATNICQLISNKSPVSNNENSILEKLKIQGDKIRDLKIKKADKTTIDSEVKTLLALKADYKNLTGKEWKPDTPTKIESAPVIISKPFSSREEEILNKIAAQGEKVRDIKAKKLDKSIVDAEVKILLKLKADYKSLTGKDWTPGSVASKPQYKNEEDILKQIAAQGDKVRDIKAKTLDKTKIDAEEKILLALLVDYKSLTGKDWKPTTIASIPAETNNEEDILNKIAAQGEKVRDLKNKKADKAAIDSEVKILLALKSDYKTLTGKDWKPGTICSPALSTSVLSSPTLSSPALSSAADNNEAEILHKIAAQGEKVRDLKSKKADKSTIDSEVKVLLSLKADYKTLTGKEWKPVTTPPSVPQAFSSAADNNEEEILHKIAAQGEKVRDLKSKKADKSTIDSEVKVLLSLKADYKTLTGKEWKPVTTLPSVPQVLSSAADNNEEEILHKIAAQGEKVRDLKSKKADKSTIDSEVKILLALKADYKTLTGQEWKPGTTLPSVPQALSSAADKPVTTHPSVPQALSSAADNNEEEILHKIAAQGEKVRDLKSKKADKSTIDSEVKVLLALKADYKTLTGKEWKPVTTPPSVPQALSSAADKPVTTQPSVPQALSSAADNNEEEILLKIAAQGEKVRDLKTKKADKSTIDSEVKILLALKADYKTLTGKEWKPVNTLPSVPQALSSAADNVTTLPSVPQPSSPVLSSAADNSEEEILHKIAAQGEKVRDLKSKKADKSTIDSEVKILLALKADYKTLTGKEWKPVSAPPSAPQSSHIPVRQTPQTSDADIQNKIVEQGDKVRKLKAEKAEKNIIDAEVKSLLALKAEYKTLTGKDWKPETTQNSAVSIPSDMPNSTDKDLTAMIAEQGDKVRKLKAEKAEKNIIDAEVKSLLSLKAEYKTRTGKDWTPETTPQNSTVSMPSPDLQNSTDRDNLTAKISEQGNVVRNLKSSGGSKEDIDAAVKVLLDLKAEYKKVTGTDFPVPGRPIKPKESKPKEAKPAIKKVPSKDKKPVDATEVDGVKKQTRLGLEAKKEENLPDWYSQVITKGEMIEYYDVSGCYIYRPWSYAIWELIKNWFDEEIKKLGVQNCYFPIFVSKSVLEKEKTHIADFAPEVAWVTKSGESDMAEPIAVRPTSETVMYPAYAKWIQSYRDLPIKLNQWNNVVVMGALGTFARNVNVSREARLSVYNGVLVPALMYGSECCIYPSNFNCFKRWEFKHPQPFLRTREFLWQEGHTAYATVEEAQQEVSTILDLYARIYTDLLAIPVVKGRKTEKEKFAGGDYTLTVEAYVSASGRAIQGATSHHLGQNFSKMFDITFEDPETQEKKFVYQNSWGVTTRTIGVMIMIHADNQGLVLPPQVASVQIVIVPCGITVSLSDDEKAALQNSCDALESDLSKAGVRVKGDYRNNYSPGWKFNHWELKGVPIRVELGPKDIKNNQLVAVRRDTGEKITIQRDNAVQELSDLLKIIQQSLYNRALNDLNSHKVQLNEWSQFTENLDNKNIILAPFCGETECEDKIKADSARDDAEAEPGAPAMGAKSLCIPLEQPAEIQPTDKCIHPSCNRKPKFYTLFGRSY